MITRFNKACMKAYVNSALARQSALNSMKSLLKSDRGESEWTNTAIKIIIGIVIGGLVLGILIFIIGNTTASSGLAKTMKDKIDALFNPAP